MTGCKVKIVDEMMGRGKSSAAINYINGSKDRRFLVITPYLDEIKRYKSACPSRHFTEPIYKNGSKLNSIKELIRAGKNIVSTHSLFSRFDEEVVNLCRVLNYSLIMDEVADVVEGYPLSEDDQALLLSKYCTCEEGTRLLRWKEEFQDYEGKFSEVKNLCNMGSLAVYGGDILMWLFPIEVFNAFEHIYILTYMFNAQLQRYYYDYYGMEYRYIHVTGNSIDTYMFSEEADDHERHDYRKLIHVIENEKLNIIGDGTHDLSKAWYERNNKTPIMEQLKKNLYNYFRNIRKDNAKDNLWTTFNDYKSSLSGAGYTRGFLALNARATNDYRDRTSVAYMVNRYINPIIKSFFLGHGVNVDENGFALSEMIQFIWRSAIRDGKEIWLYIPSSRMRKLLLEWIEVNSKGNEEINTIKERKEEARF